MTLTPEQLEQRKKGIGGSEIGAVAGIHPYKTALDVYLEKIGLREEGESKYQEWGNRLEQALGDAYADKQGEHPGWLCRNLGTLVGRDQPWMIATPDAIVPESHGLECKVRGAYDAHRWGTELDQVPDEVAAQCHWGMLVTRLRRWDVAVLLGGNDFRVYTLRFDDVIAASLTDIGRRFWNDHVLKEVPPEITPQNAAAAQRFVKRIFPSHDDAMLTASAEHDALCHALRTARVERKQAEAVEEMWQARVKAAIGEHSGIMGSDYKVTWRATKAVKKTDWRALATWALSRIRLYEERHPEALASHPRSAAVAESFISEEPGSRRFLPTFPGERDE